MVFINCQQLNNMIINVHGIISTEFGIWGTSDQQYDRLLLSYTATLTWCQKILS